MSDRIYYPPRMSGTKICPRCKKDLPVIFFAVNRRNKDGLHSDCRKCSSEIIAKTPSKVKARDLVAKRKEVKAGRDARFSLPIGWNGED